MSEPFLGTALVSIQVDPKGFRAQLRATVQKSIGTTPFKIPITPDLVAFRREINKQLKLAPIKVPVVPDLTVAKFREQLLAKIRSASQGIRVRVPVDVVGGVGTRGGVVGAAGGAGGTRGRSAEEKAAADAEATAQKQASAAEKIRRTTRAQLNDLELRGAAIEKDLAAAVDSSLPAEQQKAQLETVLAQAERNRIASTEALTAAQRAQNIGMVQSLTAINANALALERKAARDAAAVAFNIEFVAAQENADVAIEQANAFLAQNISELTTKAEVQKAANAQTRIAAVLTKSAAEADAVGAAATAAYVRELRAQVVAQEEVIAAQRQSIIGGAKFDKSLGQVAKGTQASVAGLLGLRGAVLAAGAEFLGAVVAIQLVSKAIGAASGLQKQLNVFRVTAEATSTQMEAVRREAIALGNDITLPGVNARDAANAITELAKAGLSVQDSLAGARGVLELATAAEIDNTQATNIVASALNAFGLRGADAVHIADLLANASIKAQGGISEMGAALNSVAAVSREVGISVDDTVALITLLAKNGLQGATAGTTLRVALLRLVNPSKAAAGELKSLNVQLRDANGNIRPDIFAQLAIAAEHLAPAQRDAAFATIFGTRAIRAQAILGREGVGALNEMRAAVERQGAAQELAHAQTAGLSGSVEALKNTLETLGLTLADLTLPPLQLFVGTVNQMLAPIAQATSFVDNLVHSLGSLKIPDINIPIHIGPIQTDINTEKDSKNFGDRVGGFISAAIHSRLLKDQAAGAFVPGATQALEVKQFATGFLPQPDKAKADITDIQTRVEKLFKTFRQEGQGPTALNELILGLEGLAAQLDKLGPKGQQFATRIRAILIELQNLAAGGAKIPPINLKVQLDPTSIANIPQTGTDTAKDFYKGFSDDLLKEPIFAVPELLFSGFTAAATKAGADTGKAFSSALSTQIALAQANGANNATLIGLFEKQIADARKRIAHFTALEQAPGITAKEHAKLEGRIREAAGTISSAQGQIKSIRSQAESDAKKAAQDAITAKNKADQAFIDKFTLGSNRRQNAIAKAAESKKTLKDDIAAEKAFRDLIVGTIDAAAKGIKDAKTRAQFLVQAKADLIQVNSTLKDLNAQQKQLLKDQAQAARDLREENLTLDFQIAQTMDNKTAEARALNREIAFYRRQSRNKDLTAIERKRYLLKLRQAQADLKDLKKQLASNNRAQQEFAFLQTQQGFAANLFGNLIPGGFTNLVGGGNGPNAPPVGPPRRVPGGFEQPRGGVTGGGGGTIISSPSSALSHAAAIAAASDRGFSRGDVNRLLHLTQQLVNEVQRLNRGGEHSAAKHVRHRDTVGADHLGS